MDQEESKKLIKNLEEELVLIDRELATVASENPLIRGDFDVKVEDIGPSIEDAAQEAGELDRRQALVNSLEKRRKEIVNTIAKIKAGDYSPK